MPSQGVPLKVLRTLATLMALADEPWCAPSGVHWLQLNLFRFGTGLQLQPPDVWVGHLTICVDGAKDGRVWRVGALAPFLGVRVL